MSQGNWGGGPGGGWGGQGGGPPPGGGGYGPPPGGAPPGGGGYGPPPGGAPPGGGGYGPPPGGAPPGGGGYGPPPGGGGYGPPPGGGGYGPPPGGGGYGAPPGGGGFAPPPAGFPPAYQGAAPLGTRVRFSGEGGKLFVTYLLYNILPFVGVYVVGGGLIAVGAAIDDGVGAGGVLAAITGLIGGLIVMAGLLFVSLLFMNKFYAFYYENLALDNQTCRYTGTLGSLFKVQFLNSLLIMVTFGIYTPWAIVKLKQWQYENVEVNGQKGRLTFSGDGGTLFGKYLLGMLLLYCTAFIYGPWFANDLFAFMWENTKLDGRAYTFQKDPGGFFGTYLLTMLLTYCTGGIYMPWGICNILKWEAERVT